MRYEQALYETEFIFIAEFFITRQKVISIFLLRRYEIRDFIVFVGLQFENKPTQKSIPHAILTE